MVKPKEIHVEKTISMGPKRYEFLKVGVVYNLENTDTTTEEAVEAAYNEINTAVLACSHMDKLQKAIYIDADPERFTEAQVEWAAKMIATSANSHDF